MALWGAHAHTFRRRTTRQTTALTQAGVGVFGGRAGHEVFEYAEQLSLYGVKPLTGRPPERARQSPYSTSENNQRRTASDLWDDLAKGRMMASAKKSDPFAGEPMESRWHMSHSLTRPTRRIPKCVIYPTIESNRNQPGE